MKIEITMEELKELIKIIKDQKVDEGNKINDIFQVIAPPSTEEKKPRKDPNGDIMFFSNTYITNRTKELIKESNINEVIDALKKDCDKND